LTALNPSSNTAVSGTLIWVLGVSFSLFQFFLQLSSGIVIGAIMEEQNMSALTAGLLSSSFYYVYTGLQIPVGLLFDKYNSRFLISVNAAVCALGCFIFAYSPNLPMLFLGRFVIGAGSAFSFIGVTHILRRHFPVNQYAFMVGLSETLGFSLTVFGMVGLGSLIHNFGWRSFIGSSGLLCFLLSTLCWRFIPSYRPKPKSNALFKKYFLEILRNKYLWFNGIFVCLEFSVITVFTALWAVPFLQLKLHCSLEVTGLLTAMTLLGAGFSCPLFGLASTRFNTRKPLIHGSCISTALLLVIVLYLPTQNLWLMGSLMFALGLCCGAYMLSYSISNDLAPKEALSTATGFTNTLAVLSGPVLQPLIGFLLDLKAQAPGVYSIADYQLVLLILPASLIIASWFAHYLPQSYNCASPPCEEPGLIEDNQL
jgi:MFS family permease